MAFLISIHPQNPQPRLVRQAIAAIRDGSVVVYPTDSSYALGCLIGDKEAMERIRRIRDVDVKHHNFTLVCRDLSEIAKYARVDNSQYRTLKAFTPGPYTFLLEATRGREAGPFDRTVDVQVGRLRRKLESDNTGDATNAAIIKSVRGAGYLLAVPVTTT